MQSEQLQVLQASDPPLLLHTTRDIPPPASGEVQICVEASSINPIDTKRARGYGRRLLSLKHAARFPITLGNDFVGHVIALGSGVTGLRQGDRVIGVQPTGPWGSHCSVLNAPANCVRCLPSSARGYECATLPYTYTTSRLALAGAGLHTINARGLNVLVHGASGGLGQLALQTLARWGALTTAICRAPDADLCRALGATTIWDRQEPGWREGAAQFDATLNFASWDDEAWLLSKLKRGGLGHATTVHPLLDTLDHKGWVAGTWQCGRVWLRHKQMARQAAGRECNYAWTIFKPDANALDDLVTQLLDSDLRMAVQGTYPLSKGIAAFAAAHADSTRRVILRCGQPSVTTQAPPSCKKP